MLLCGEDGTNLSAMENGINGRAWLSAIGMGGFDSSGTDAIGNGGLEIRSSEQHKVLHAGT
jgi:hypothetical protein